MPQIHRLYIPELDPQKSTFELTKPDVHVVANVLRLAVGADVVLLNGQGLEVQTRIASLTKHDIALEKQSMTQHALRQPKIHITVGALKGDKAAWIIQKLTEIGVARISWFQARFSIAKHKHEAQPKSNKLTKWQRVAIEAMRQSGNPYMPEIRMFKNLTECMAEHEDNDIKICLHEKSDVGGFETIFQKPARACHVMVGPEGGFSKDEVEMMKTKGYAAIHCAPFVLRSETAAIYMASVLQAHVYSRSAM